MRKDAALPITLIVVGLVWLVWRMGWFPDRDWLIGIGFIAGGIGVFVIDRITKSSVVIGPFLIAIGLFWLAREQYRLRLTIIMPVMLILLGCLMLVARSASIPEHRIKTAARTDSQDPQRDRLAPP